MDPTAVSWELSGMPLWTILYEESCWWDHCDCLYIPTLSAPWRLTCLLWHSWYVVRDLGYCFRCLVAKSCSTLCDPMDCSMPGSPVLHYLPEFAQIHVHWVRDAIQPSYPLPTPPCFPFCLQSSQHQSLFQWVGSSHQVAKVLELQLQHQSFQWIFRSWFPLGFANLISSQCLN